MRFAMGGTGRVLAALVLAAGLTGCDQARDGPRPPVRRCPTATAGTDRSGAGPVFYVTDPAGCGAHAYTYSGERTGGTLAFPSCIEACRPPAVAPDGWQPPISPGTSGGLSSTIWAADSRHRCGFPPGLAHPIRVGWSDARTTEGPRTATYTGLFRKAPRVDLVGCDLTDDRAVLTAQSTSSVLEAVAVVSLHQPKVLFERHFTGSAGTRVIAVSVAPNGRVMAFQYADLPPSRTPRPAPAPCSPATRAGRSFTMCALSPAPAAPLPIPTRVELYTLSDMPHRLAQAPHRKIVGWSGDGSRLITQPGYAPGGGVTVLRTGNGQLVWQTAGTFNLAVSAPGLSTIAIQTFTSPGRRSSIDLIDPLGRVEHLSARGQLIPPAT